MLSTNHTFNMLLSFFTTSIEHVAAGFFFIVLLKRVASNHSSVVSPVECKHFLPNEKRVPDDRLHTFRKAEKLSNGERDGPRITKDTRVYFLPF